MKEKIEFTVFLLSIPIFLVLFCWYMVSAGISVRDSFNSWAKVEINSDIDNLIDQYNWLKSNGYSKEKQFSIYKDIIDKKGVIGYDNLSPKARNFYGE